MSNSPEASSEALSEDWIQRKEEMQRRSEERKKEGLDSAL